MGFLKSGIERVGGDEGGGGGATTGGSGGGAGGGGQQMNEVDLSRVVRMQLGQQSRRFVKAR